MAERRNFHKEDIGGWGGGGISNIGVTHNNTTKRLTGTAANVAAEDNYTGMCCWAGDALCLSLQ